MGVCFIEDKEVLGKRLSIFLENCFLLEYLDFLECFWIERVGFLLVRKVINKLFVLNWEL